MKIKGWALCLVVALCVPGVVAASEESRKLTARGLYLLQSNFEADALKVFEEAVSADASDVDARYYRGMLRGSRGDLGAAVADLRAVMAARPDFDQAALELGVGLVHNGAFSEAGKWLEQAQRNARFESKASLYLGLAQLRMQELDAAKRNFERVGADDAKLAQAARYYLGVVAYQQERWQDAEQSFQAVASQQTGSSFEAEASTFLDLMKRREQAPYRMRGAVGFEYDTNVLLAPGDELLKDQAGVSRQQDGRFSISAGGSYFWRFDPVRVALGYDFYQSLHFDLQEFNLQDHRPALEVTANLGAVQLGVLGEYNFYLKQDNRFLQEGTVLPWIAIAADEWGRSEFSYRLRRRDFLQDEFAVRDAFNHAFAARQVVFLGAPERYLSLGYRFDIDDPVRSGDSERFAYFANEVNTGIGWQLPFEVTAEASYAFRHERYKGTSNNYTNRIDARRDNESDIVVALARQLSESLSVTVGYSGTINNSNALAFKYDRHITSLALQVGW